ncbi:MAG: SDR family NAD(P)-dependent oxidoreductase [Myxococcales bacterium]|nr:SDR family NAD(P)-dependent oxidoreductase [Myxococcales bacterium]
MTGAARGLGLRAATALAGRGARVVFACRNVQRAAVAMSRIAEEQPEADLHFEPLDPEDLVSVHTFAATVLDRHERIHLLVNNADVVPWRKRRRSGTFEGQIGLAHLGHFALTNLLLERIVASAPARIVTVTSLERHRVRRAEASHASAADALTQSRRTNRLFTLELSRRLRELSTDVRAVTCAPRFHDRWTVRAPRSWLANRLSEGLKRVSFAALDAATTADVASGEDVGPPRRSLTQAPAAVLDDARRLWAWSEAETGVHWPLRTEVG